MRLLLLLVLTGGGCAFVQHIDKQCLRTGVRTICSCRDTETGRFVTCE